MTRLTDIVVSENPRTAYEQKEMALGEIWGRVEGGGVGGGREGDGG